MKASKEQLGIILLLLIIIFFLIIMNQSLKGLTSINNDNNDYTIKKFVNILHKKNIFQYFLKKGNLYHYHG